ncbi:MAG: alpha/beta hydrolase [Pseudomonadales bacterium]
MRPIPVCLLLASLLASAGHGAVTRDIDYLSHSDYAESKDRLDVHMPEGVPGAPVLVYFHGGALMFGDKSLGDPVAERLLPLGIGVVSANYRLSPAFRHPAHVADAAAALAWTVRHIAEYGGDPEQVYVAGHSAGAYLAALLMLDASHLDAHGLNTDAIAGGVLISPFLYVEETAPERPLTVWGADPEGWLAASVTPHIASGRPPILLLFADADDAWRQAQIRRFAAALRDHGNSAIDLELSDRDHRSLISRILEVDDRIGAHVSSWIGGLQTPHRG